MTIYKLDAVPISIGNGRGVPTEFRLFKLGKNSTKKGTFLFDKKSAESVLKEAAEHGADKSIDYEHAQLDPYSRPLDRIAAGWFTPQLRDDGLWASDVKWTARAAEAISSKEWRYYSPAFAVEMQDKGPARIVQLINVALTNLPATNGLQALITSQIQSGQEPQKGNIAVNAIAIALGLAADATDREVLASIASLELVTKQLSDITGKKTPQESVGTVLAWKEAAEKTQSLLARVEQMETETLSMKVNKLVDDAIDKKHLAPAKRAWAIELGSKDIRLLTGYLQDATPVVAVSPVTPPASTQIHAGLSREELEAYRVLGITPDDAAKRKEEAKKYLGERRFFSAGEPLWPHLPQQNGK